MSAETKTAPPHRSSLLTAQHLSANSDPMAITDMQLFHLARDDHLRTYRVAEYIWIDADGGLRSKTRVLDRSDKHTPNWNFDGSSTNQAEGHDSEIELVPVKEVPDPIFGEDHFLVLCECYKDGAPAKGNYRSRAVPFFTQHDLGQGGQHTWFGIEQEYTLMKPDNKRPIGWPDKELPARQGPYYCSVGAERCFGRKLASVHLLLCLDAGLTMSGKNAEVMPGQWEFQVGPCKGVDAGDQLWLARYLLLRTAEMMGLIVSFHPKPLQGDWNGSGLHTNFSTALTRDTQGRNGWEEIQRIMKVMERPGSHEEHLEEYGDNTQRLTGQHETSDPSVFSFGVADRGASVRIPKHVQREGGGYFEDRRPASSADPYRVCLRLLQTAVSR